jgi:DNA-binding transcriptional MerR regulator
MAEERLYMTAELRAAAGISRTTMDFYLRKGILSPTERSESGQLLFAAAERDKLLRIVGYRRQGYNLREIRQMLEKGPPT